MPVRSRLVFCLSGLVAGCLIGNARADDPRRDYAITARAVTAVLAELARESGLQPVYAVEDVRAAQSPGVQGQFTLREALGHALSGTGLVYEFTGERTVAIRRAAIAPPTRLPTLEIRDSTLDEDPTAYTRRSASTATKIDTPLLQTPVKVEVLTQQILRDQGTTSRGLTDALASLGLQTLGQGELGEVIFYRGFVTSTTLWNGFRIEDLATNTGPVNGSVWMDNVERVEVMRGPSSVLYGRAEPGGAVNVITKKPLESFGGELRAGLGSFSNRWLAADLGGPLRSDGSLRFRLSGSIESSDNWYRYGPRYESRGLAPALDWQPSAQTSVSFEGQFRTMRGSSTQAYMPVDPVTQTLLPIAPARTLQPGAQSTFHQNRLHGAIRHQFDGQWSLALKYLYNDVVNPLTVFPLIIDMQYPGTLGSVATATRGLITNRGDQQVHAAMLELTGKLDTFALRHTLLAGTDYYRTRSYQNQNFDCWCTQYDYFNPPPVLPAEIPGDYYAWNIRQREFSFYLQDQIELPLDFHLLVGGRLQRLIEYSRYEASDGSYLEELPYQRSVLLPRAALLWQPLGWLSAYYSYGENAGSSQGLAFPGRPLAPESSRQHELGAKGEWLEGRLNATLALFSLIKSNLAAPDVAHPGFNLGVGKVRSRGYEFSLQGAPTRHLSVVATANHAKPLVLRGTDDAGYPASALQPLAIRTGTTLPYFSKHALSLLASYRLPFEGWQGWKLGGSYQWYSAPTRDDNSAVETHPYALMALFVGYQTQWQRYTLDWQLNVNNVFDKQYLLYQGDVGKVQPDANFVGGNWGTPRQARFSLRLGF